MKKVYYKHHSHSQNTNYFILNILSRALHTIYKILYNLISLPFRLLPGRLMRRLSRTQRLFVNMVIASIMLVFGVWVLTGVLNPFETKAAWFDGNWQYRVTVPVTNTGSALANAQVPIATDTATLVTASKMRSDCRDIRVTTQTGKVLKHWVHQCNTATTRVYVFVDQIPAGSSNLYLYYGNGAASQNKEVKTGITQFPGISCKTILDHGDSAGNGTYQIDPNAGSPTDAFTAYCDMTTDGGGWTIVNSSNGTTNQQGLVSDTEVSGNPFSNESSNISLIKKRDIATTSAESLFKRSTGVWLKASVALFDGNLTTANQHTHNTDVTLTANDGTTVSTAVAGYSNYNNSLGGDYGITTSVGFDHHSTNYYHLRASCANHYLYKYGTTYNVNTTLGSWVQTHSCVSSGTQMGAWYAAMRGTSSPIPGYLSISTPTNEELSNGPIAFWKFDEGQGVTAYDSTSNKYNGTISSATWQRNENCISGNCLLFNGTSSGIDTNKDFSWTSTSPYSFSVWIKPNLITGDHPILGKTSYEYVLLTDENKIKFVYWSSAGAAITSLTSTTNIVTNQWYHIVITSNGTAAKMYINGVLESTDSDIAGTNQNRTESLKVGYSYTNHGDGAGTHYFQGIIDQVKIYPYDRTYDQVKLDLSSRGSVAGASIIAGAANTSALSNGLVGYWKMDEASWTTDCSTLSILDTSGNSSNARACPNSTGPSAGAYGKFGNGANLDGSDDRILVNYTSALALPTDFSFSLWLYNRKASGTTDPKGILYHETYLTNGMRINVNTNNTLSLLTTQSGGTLSVTSSTALGQNQWYYLTFTYSSKTSTGTIFINGQQAASGTGTYIPNTSSAFEFGDSAGDPRYNLDGILDEVRIYNRSISPSEVQQLYNYAPGPVAYFDFEDRGISSLADKSGNGNNGTWNGTGAHYTSGVYGTGGKFNGSDDWVNVGALGVTGDSTVEAWVYPEDTGSTGTYGIMGNSQATRLTWSGTTFQYFINNNSWTPTYRYVQTGVSYPLNKWYHVAGVRDSQTSTLKIYINGILVNTTTSIPSDTVADLGWTIVKRDSNIGFKGKMDEIKVYNYPRTQGQIVSDMNAGHPLGGSPIGSQALYTKFDEGYGTAIRDSGPNRIDGTLTSATWSNDGKFGKTIKTNGSSSYASIPDHNAIDYVYNQDFTVSFWMRDGGGSSNGDAIVEKWAGSGGYPYVFRYNSNSIQMLRYDGTNNPSVAGTKTINDGAWHHILGQKVGSTLYLYIDGIRQTTGTTDTTTGTTTNSSAIYIGARGGSSQFWNGYVDELKIYSAGLTASEIKLEYNRGSSLSFGALGTSDDGKTASNSADRAYCVPGDTTSTCSPIAEWEFDEKNGSTANDTSGTGLTGTISGAAWTQGKIGSGLNFDGSDDYVSVGSSDTLNITGDLSIEAWIYPTGWGESNYGRIFERYNGADGYRLFLAQDGSNNWLSFYANGQVYSGVGSISLNRWHHVIVTVSGTTVTFFINGVAYNAGTIAGIVSAPSTTAYIGNNGATDRSFKGKIDHVKIYNYAQSASQASYNYNKGRPVAHWKMDECQGLTLNDTSGNGFTGTITIGATGTQASAGTCQTASTAWGNGATGKFNSSLNFDGTDDYASFTSTNVINPTSGTVSVWAKTNGSQASPSYIFSHPGTGDNSRVYLNFASGGFGVRCGLGANTTIGSYTMTDGVWTHLVCTWNGTTGAFYVNGVNKTSTPSFSGLTSAVATSYIGSFSGASQLFTGQIDDVQIFNYPLTQAQVRNVMNQGGAVRFGPLTGSP